VCYHREFLVRLLEIPRQKAAVSFVKRHSLSVFEHLALRNSGKIFSNVLLSSVMITLIAQPQISIDRPRKAWQVNISLLPVRGIGRATGGEAYQ
jgi:hypothetical protein